jgi:ATP-dependent helicase HrpB
VRQPLPIDPHIPEIVARVREHRAAVVVAPPGAGKTTRVPPAFADGGSVIVLQPRRVAARAIARRIADERGWTLGGEVGWHVRFERRFGAGTRLLVATEGILTARLQQDPLLSDFRTIILDEFHERSIHADLGLALARQAWLARQDLAVVVMSATIDARAVSEFLGGCPVIEIPGRLHPLDVRYAPGRRVTDAALDALRTGSGQVLCFLPGAWDIRRAEADLAGAGADIVPLHGALGPAEQDAAIAAAPGRRRIVLATNIAETSLTVPGVSAVVDTGLHKVARYDPERAVDSLETERISQDSADQRAGRAARLGPGTAWRLWHPSDRLRPHREPDIARIDLAGPVLDILAWGGDPRAFEWYEQPRMDAVEAALDLLRQLGAVIVANEPVPTGSNPPALTDVGRRMQRLPLSPRLARILIDAAGAYDAALACALLGERHFFPSSSATTSSDLQSAIERGRDLPPQVLRAATELHRIAGGSHSTLDERSLRRAVFTGYPDRLGKRRAPGSPRVLLSSGHGAVITAQSGVRGGEYLAALDVTAGRRGEGAEAQIRIASVVDREWLTPTEARIEHWVDESTGAIRAAERQYYGAIVITERPLGPDPLEASRLLAAAYVSRGLTPADEQLIRRLRFAGLDAEVPALASGAAQGKRSLDEMQLVDGLPSRAAHELERLAPDRLKVPSGRTVALEYRNDGSIAAEVKLQELFGLADTPVVGIRREPVVLGLLAPNGRPVQITRDLRSFWERTYPEVRKQLRGRYPKHPWPEDPWTARPTARTKRSPNL